MQCTDKDDATLHVRFLFFYSSCSRTAVTAAAAADGARAITLDSQFAFHCTKPKKNLFPFAHTSYTHRHLSQGQALALHILPAPLEYYNRCTI